MLVSGEKGVRAKEREKLFFAAGEPLAAFFLDLIQANAILHSPG